MGTGLTLLLLGALLALVVFCGVCMLHARAMTHFVRGGERTPNPEDLSPLRRVAVLLTGVRVPRPDNQRTPSALDLASETHHVRCEHGPTLELWHLAAEEPLGLVVLCHGYAASKDQLLETARALHDARWTVLMLDFSGSGGSSGHRTTLGHGEARDVVATVRWAREHLDADMGKLVLYGFSMGSAAILRAVGVHRLGATAIVVESPFDRMLTTVRHRFELMGVPSFPSAQLLVLWGGVTHGFNAFAHNPVDYAARVDTPTLVLIGALDHRVRTDEARAVAKACSGQLEVFDDVGHEQVAAADPRGWRAAVLPFLDEL